MARGRTQDVHQSTVLMNGKQADDEMKRLTKRADEFGRKKREAFEKNDLTAYKKWDQSLRGVNKEIRNLKLETKSVEAILKDINGASFEDIRKAANKANRELKQMRQNDPGFKEKSKQAEVLNTKYRQMSRDMRGVQNTGKGMFGSLADGFNRYFAIATAFAASITGMILGFKRLSEEIAALDDVYSDVMKTTGMTRDEVVDLNEEFKQMDTRAAREQLNMLARDAGKLGITGKKDILDFVEAGNQINVALGEDLGEDAIKQIGKMVGVYKNASSEINSLDLKGQMLAVGSAINELGATSTASEPYLVQFSGRLGGVAQQAGISMSAILGYASALDQDMQAVEMSATALQNFIMKLMGDPAKFAKLAGLEVKSFTNLLKTDANAAIKQVLRSLNEKGGFQQLIPIFQEMGLDGARAVGVLSSMAGGIDKIEKAQITASKAMIEGISITKEYDIKNNNLQARLDKSRKKFREKALVLGEKLSPALLVSTNAMSYMTKIIIALIDFVVKYGAALASAAVMIGTYTIAVNAATIAIKAKQTWLLLAEKAQKLFNATAKANPYVLVASAVAGLVTWLITYTKRTKEAAEAQKQFNEYLEDTEDLLDRTKTLEDRAKTMQNMSKEQLSRFKSDAQQELEHYKQLEDKKLLALHAYQDEVQKLEKYVSQNAETEAEKRALYNNKYVTAARDEAFRVFSEISQLIDQNKGKLETYIADADKMLGASGGSDNNDGEYRNAAGQTFEEWKKANEAFRKLQEEYLKENPPVDFSGLPNRSDESGIDDTFSDPLAGMDELFAQQKLKLDEQRADGLLSQADYNTQLEDLEIAHLLTMLELRKQLGLDTMDIEQKLLAKRIENQQNAEKEQLASQQRMMQQYAQFAQIGASAIEDFIGGNEDALKQGAKAMINMALDILKANMQMAIAGATIQSLVQPDSIASFGISGLARAAVIVGLIEAAFAGIKGVVGATLSNMWSGGFTGPGEWDKPQGIVHSNEFVANRFATQNPTVRPVLDMIDYAQRSGNISQLNLPAAMAAAPGTREIIRESATTVDPESIKILAELRDEIKKGIRSYVVANQDYARAHTEYMDKYNKRINQRS